MEGGGGVSNQYTSTVCCVHLLLSQTPGGEGIAYRDRGYSQTCVGNEKMLMSVRTLHVLEVDSLFMSETKALNVVGIGILAHSYLLISVTCYHMTVT